MGRRRPLGSRDLLPLACFALLAWGAWGTRATWQPVLTPNWIQAHGDAAPADGAGTADGVSPGDDASAADGPAPARADADVTQGPEASPTARLEQAPAPGRPADEAGAFQLATASPPSGEAPEPPSVAGASTLAESAADEPSSPVADGSATGADAPANGPDLAPTWVPGSRSSPLEQAFAAAPHDPATLAPLLASLLEAGRPDLARERLVIHGEEGADPAQVETLLVAHDPHRAAKADVLVGAAEQLVTAADACSQRELWRNAWALLDGAEALLDGARLETGQALCAERAGSLPAELASRRRQLLRDHDGLTTLAAAQAALPDNVDPEASLQADRDARADARAAGAGEPFQRSTSRHFEVRTTRGARITRQAGEVLEAAYDLARRSFDADPLASGRPLVVEVLADELAFSRRRDRREPAPLPDADAFRESDDVLVIRDPALDGGDVLRLWQVLGREARRLVVDAGLGDQARVGWLATGLALEGEATRRLADGHVRLDAVPETLLDEALASLRGWGSGRPRLESVLALGPRASGGPTWSWALVHFLRHGGPWDDPLPALLEAGDDTQGALLLRTVFLVDPAVQRAGLEDTHDLDAAWSRWLDEQRGLADGEPAALAREVERAQAAVAARAYERCAALLARIRAVAPGHAQALALAAELARKRGDRDRALLLARWLASVRDPAQAADERHGEAAEIHVGVADALLAAEAALREPVLSLARTLRDDADSLSALRLIDRALAASPLDRALLEQRAELVQTLGPDAGQVWLRPAALDDLGGLFGELELWTPTGQSLEVAVADRPEPTTLRGLMQLRPPCRVSVRLRLDADPGSTPRDDDQATLGLLFGGDEPIAYGAWGVLVSRSGRVELARRGGLEWPGTTLGRGRRGFTELTLGLGLERLSVAVDGRPPVILPRGSRPVAGWLALRARRTRGAFLQLSVLRSRQPDPAASWFVTAR